MFGVQADSKKATAPIFGFGSADRSAMEKVFMTAEHAKSSYGKNSPGPVYELKVRHNPRIQSIPRCSI